MFNSVELVDKLAPILRLNRDQSGLSIVSGNTLCEIISMKLCSVFGRFNDQIGVASLKDCIEMFTKPSKTNGNLCERERHQTEHVGDFTRFFVRLVKNPL